MLLRTESFCREMDGNDAAVIVYTSGHDWSAEGCRTSTQQCRFEYRSQGSLPGNSGAGSIVVVPPAFSLLRAERNL
jgi:hypothetical protein